MNAVSFLYEDASLVIVDKPAGVTVLPAPGFDPSACLRDRAAAALGTTLWAVHRRDRDSSGVVVLARTADAHRALAAAFTSGTVASSYATLVVGVPPARQGVIDMPLHEARRGKARPAAAGESGGRKAISAYTVTGAWQRDGQRLAAVTATPRTVVHHQVRVHLRAIGTPILGDVLYGSAATRAIGEVPVPRLALHAASIDVPHPGGERRVVASAPWPADLAAVTTWLDAQWTAEAAP